MDSYYDPQEVSVKAVLFNRTRDKIIVCKYSPQYGFGLPGGHIDTGELPDTAICRELLEELGAAIDHLTPERFFVRDVRDVRHKIILGYSGIIDESIPLVSSESHEEPVWMTRSEFTSLDKMASGYRAFALDMWK